MINNKVVYLHRKKTDNSIFYVGMGNYKRAFSKQRSKDWHSIVNSCGYTVEIINENLTPEKACEIEIKLIEKYGRLDLKTGCLVNKTSGGIGCLTLSNSSSEKKSKLLKSILRTESWKRNISKSHKGKKKSKSHIENIRSSMTGRKLPLSTRRKMKISNKSKEISAVKVECYYYDDEKLIGVFSSVREASMKIGCLETSICNNMYGRSKLVFSKILKKKVKFKRCN